MSAEYDVKSVLLDLMKEGENKTCIDCDVPMPQWASLSFGVFCCLTCSGAHRGLGVHISFVRSLTMDKWTEAQVTKSKSPAHRLRIGGNEKARRFFESSPGYSKNMSIQDKYTSHFAAQYKDKLLAEIEGREWSPSDTPAPAASTNTSALRKPRATGPTRGLSSTRSESPQQAASSPSYNQKAANEDYFARMGAANDSRRADLPPSQGGKYAGFGSDASYTPSNSTSSRALPGIDDFRDDPVSALGRGWGFLGAALSQASKSINESVVQPTLERVADPTLQSQISSYATRAGTVLTEASRRGGEVLSTGLQSGGELIHQTTGYNAGDLGAGYVDRVTGRGAGGGYAQVGSHTAPTGDSGDDFFSSQLGGGGSGGRMGGGGSSYADASPSMSSNTSSPAGFSDYQSATAPAPTLSSDDTWAKLAPQSAARSGASSRAASGRSSPAVQPKKAAKSDDWDDFGDDWK